MIYLLPGLRLIQHHLGLRVKQHWSSFHRRLPQKSWRYQPTFPHSPEITSRIKWTELKIDWVTASKNPPVLLGKEWNITHRRQDVKKNTTDSNFWFLQQFSKCYGQKSQKSKFILENFKMTILTFTLWTLYLLWKQRSRSVAGIG